MPGDDFNNVALGQAGTGAAFVLPNTAPDPIALIQRNREQAKLEQDKLNAAHAKNLQDMDSKFGTALPQDYPYLEGLKDNLIKAYAFEYQNGRDPQDPTNPNFQGLQNLKQQTMDAYNASRQQQVGAAALQKTISDNPDKFDTDTTQHLLQVYLNGFNNPIDRSKSPFPNPVLNKPSFGDNIEAYQNSKNFPQPSNWIEGNKEITGYKPDQQAQIANNLMVEKPDTAKRIMDEVDSAKTAKPDVYQIWQEDADKMNKALVANGQPPTATPYTAHALGYLNKINKNGEKAYKDPNAMTDYQRADLGLRREEMNQKENGGNGGNVTNDIVDNLMPQMSRLATGSPYEYNAPEEHFGDVPPTEIQDQSAPLKSNSFSQEGLNTITTQGQDNDGNTTYKVTPNAIDHWEYNPSDRSLNVFDLKSPNGRKVKNFYSDVIYPYVHTKYDKTNGDTKQADEILARMKYLAAQKGIDLTRVAPQDMKSLLPANEQSGNSSDASSFFGNKSQSTPVTSNPKDASQFFK